MKLEHIVRFENGHDCIRFECINGQETCKPNTGGSHGVHGMEIRFISKGTKGAVQFLLSTGWLPQHTKESNIGSLDIESWTGGHSKYYPIPVDLGYHSKKPMYKGQTSMGKCEFCDGNLCYYDGSTLSASKAMYTLVNGGEVALWKFLDNYYMARFEKGEYPKHVEYKMPLRKI